MARLPILAALLALAFAVSGCSDAAPAATDEAPADATGHAHPAEGAGAPRVRSGGDAFGWALFAGVPGMGPDAGVFTTINTFPIEVPPGAARLDVNATWSCASPTCALHFYLYAPGEHDGASPSLLRQEARVHGAGEAQAAFSVDAPTAGTWTLNLYPDGATADVDGAWTYVVS